MSRLEKLTNTELLNELATVSPRTPISQTHLISQMRTLAMHMNRGEKDFVIGNASEDYILFCLDDIKRDEPKIKIISQTQHSSLLDALGIDIAILYRNVRHTFIQVATQAQHAHHKRKNISDKILVIPAFDYQNRLLDPLLVKYVVLVWHYDRQMAASCLWESINKSKI